MVEPYHTLCTQILLEADINLSLRQGLVAMRCHETAGRGEYSALTIALDRAALEDKVEVGLVVASHTAGIIEMTVDLIVQIGLELLAPAVELEVEKDDVRGLRADV